MNDTQVDKGKTGYDTQQAVVPARFFYIILLALRGVRVSARSEGDNYVIEGPKEAIDQVDATMKALREVI